MALIFTLVDVQPRGSEFDCTCVVDDGLSPVKELFSVQDLNDLKERLRERAAQKTGGTVALKELLNVENQPLDISIPDSKPPDDHQIFSQNVATLRRLSSAVNLGVLAPDDPSVKTLVDTVTQGLKANPDWNDVF